MYRLLIANGSEIFANTLSRHLKEACSIRICHDGPAVLGTLGRFQPDILLLDTAMARKDTLSILRQSAFIPRRLIVTTTYMDHRIGRQLSLLGVQKALVMPAVSAVELYLRDLLEELENGSAPESLEYRTAMRLHSMGFPIHLEGYRQLCIGIPLLCRDPHQPLTKTLYPAIAEALGLPDWRPVEHDIRKVILYVWEKRDPDLWSAAFPGDVTTPPSSKKFLHRMAALVNQDAQKPAGG